MKENKYDDPEFFDAYARMDRSERGLEAAGEWPALRRLLPDLRGRVVLDLGCGYGWHCRYALESGATSVTGVDISERMIARAKELTKDSRIEYRICALEDFDSEGKSFDIVLSSLTLHYVESFFPMASKVFGCLRSGGTFVFSVEHPIFTSSGKQDWEYTSTGLRQHWPLDRYFDEGARSTDFLGSKVTKYHRTLSTYVTDILNCGFRMEALVEPVPTENALRENPDWIDELRRPMMLLLSAVKEAG